MCVWFKKNIEKIQNNNKGGPKYDIRFNKFVKVVITIKLIINDAIGSPVERCKHNELNF